MEHLALLDVSKYWSYDKCRHGEKLLPLRDATIVRVFPWFNSVPSREDEKFVEFCWYELVLYKTFCNFQNDIGHKSYEIVQNWEIFQYRPWHANRNPLPLVEQMEPDEEEKHPSPKK